jgi:hypothetical protein
VLLTKDNLAKRLWIGCTKCVFCGDQETVEHLFISCPFVKLLWRTVNFTFGLRSLSNVTNMFGNWLNGVDRQSKAMIRIGVSALCWSIWRVHNDIIFNKKTNFNFLQDILMMEHWVQLWALLLPQEQRDGVVTRCTRLQMVAWNILYRTGWQHISRLQDT